MNITTVPQTTDIYETHLPEDALERAEAAGVHDHESWQQWKDQSAASQARWLAENDSAVAAVRPTWADPARTFVDLYGDDDAPDSMEFSRVVGTVQIDQSADVTDGVIALNGAPEIRVSFTDDPAFTAEEAARVGLDLVAAAALFGEYSTVSELRKTAVAAGVTPGVLLQMTEG